MNSKVKIEMLRRMMLARLLDDNWGKSYQAHEMDGIPPSLGTGQEAVSIGTCMALRHGDFVFTTHRSMAPQVGMDLETNRIMADLYFRATGYNKGKSNHVTDIEKGVIGMGSIVGGQIPVAVGLALAFKLRGLKQVAVPFFGEGASNEGAFHEAANMAAVWKLPAIFICENNVYAISLKFEEFMATKNVAIRAKAYGMPGVTVDGNDVMAVYNAVRRAAARARRGLGPTLVECQTYRLSGHLFDDPGYYRSREEVESQWTNCPILRFRAQLRDEGVLGEEEAERLEQGVKKEIERAVEFARNSPFPDAVEAFSDIFSEE